MAMAWATSVRLEVTESSPPAAAAAYAPWSISEHLLTLLRLTSEDIELTSSHTSVGSNGEVASVNGMVLSLSSTRSIAVAELTHPLIFRP